MMNRDNRDLLVLINNEGLSDADMQTEINALHYILFHAERLDNFVCSHEIIDLTRYKIVKNKVAVKNSIRKQKDTPFIFLNSLN